MTPLQLRNRAVADEHVRPAQAQIRADRLAEAACGAAVFKGDDERALRTLAREERGVEGLHEPRVDDARRDAPLGEQPPYLQGLGNLVAQRPELDLLPFAAERTRRADRKRSLAPVPARRRRAARIADDPGPARLQRQGEQSPQVVRVGGLADRQVRQTAQHGNVEQAVVRAPVVPHAPRAVHGEDDGQLQEADVVHHLVDGALEEGRIDGDDGPHPRLRKPRRERHQMLLADAHVEEPPRKRPREGGEARPVAHGRRQRADPRIRAGGLHERVSEDLAPARGRRRLPFRMRGVERPHAVPRRGIRLRRRESPALARDDVDGHAPLVGPRDGERLLQRRDVVTIHGADVPQPQRFEERISQ